MIVDSTVYLRKPATSAHARRTVGTATLLVLPSSSYRLVIYSDMCRGIQFKRNMQRQTLQDKYARTNTPIEICKSIQFKRNMQRHTIQDKYLMTNTPIEICKSIQSKRNMQRHTIKINIETYISLNYQ